MKKLIKNSILASIFISLGVYILLTIGNPLGPFLFAFGLLSVCSFQADLFTGKAGYLWKSKSDLIKLSKILCINLVAGYIIGWIISITNPSLIPEAVNKVTSWNWSISYFLSSVFCGMVMYIAVNIYIKKDSISGILYGVPLFIFCGYQHSIANVIVMGISRSLSSVLILCIIGNFIGSIIINFLESN